jgi:putative ABC transport system permease protein
MLLSSRTSGSLLVGLQTLLVNPLRTVLSTLGVIMGVGSLVAVLSIGDGVEAFAREQIESTTDLQAMMIAPVTFDMVDHLRVPRTDYPVFGLQDVQSLSATLKDAAVVALVTEGSARFAPDMARARGVTVTATTPGAAHLMKQPLLAGRFFTDAEVRDSARVAVVSAPMVDVIDLGGKPADVIGRSIRLETTELEIIGVSPDLSRQAFLAAYIPATIASIGLAPSLSPRAPSIYVRAGDVVNVPAVKSSVESWLTATHGSWKGRASVSGGEGMRLDQARQAILIFKIVMGAFAGISLVVGGIGIMNVLLAAVTERTREIGIRKATGARNRDILVQFLAESVAITGVGAVLGVILGLSTAFGVSALMRVYTKAQLHAAFTWQTLAVAALTCVVTGLAFGTYPALRASRLSPIDAIRHE